MTNALSKSCRIIDCKQRSPEWLKWRQWKIGGSMASSIMNECPYRTDAMLYDEIVNGKEIEINADMQRGIDLESKALQNFPSFIPTCFESIERPWQIASLDGWNEKEKIIIEIKCPRKFSKTEELGKKYYGQLQHQISVMGTNGALYVEYVNGEILTAVIKKRR